MNIPTAVAGKAYGLNQEVAWSTGITLDQKFRLFNRNGSIGLDYYRTSFSNQAVVDFDKSVQEVNFYNLDGKSYSNSFLAELSYEPFDKFEVRLAYRLFDVKQPIAETCWNVHLYQSIVALPTWLMKQEAGNSILLLQLMEQNEFHQR